MSQLSSGRTFSPVHRPEEPRQTDRRTDAVGMPILLRYCSVYVAVRSAKIRCSYENRR